jgi:hypothetical protein
MQEQNISSMDRVHLFLKEGYNKDQNKFYKTKELMITLNLSYHQANRAMHGLTYRDIVDIEFNDRHEQAARYRPAKYRPNLP